MPYLIPLEHFALGVIGALITLYLAKQIVIPEFRSTVDLAALEAEVNHLGAEVARDRTVIDALLDQLRAAQPDRIRGLAESLEAAGKIYRDDQGTLERAERPLRRARAVAQAQGFVAFVLMGGVFAALFADRIEVKGVDARLPKSFQAVAIGAGWMGLLSLLGLRTSQEATRAGLVRATAEAQQQVADLKAKVVRLVRSTPSADATVVPARDFVAASERVAEAFDQASRQITGELERAQARAREEARRVI